MTGVPRHPAGVARLRSDSTAFTRSFKHPLSLGELTMTRKHVSTRRHLHFEALEDHLCLSSLPVGTSTTPTDAATQARLSAAYGKLTLSFEVNKGQTDS